MRPTDIYDDQAAELYEQIRDEDEDWKVLEAIADALREAAGATKPPHLTREQYEAVVAKARSAQKTG